MENSMWIWIGIGIGVLFLLVLLMYNSFVQKRNDADKAFAMIDAQLKKRFDLIPNLVGAVKAYMTHERETLEKITALRTRAMAPNTSGEELMAYGTEAAGLLQHADGVRDRGGAGVAVEAEVIRIGHGGLHDEGRDAVGVFVGVDAGKAGGFARDAAGVGRI